MSVTITKQAATGFPTDNLTCYAKDPATNTMYIYKISNAGAITKKALIPFPPTSFTDTGYSSLNTPTVVESLSGGSSRTAVFTAVSKFKVYSDAVYLIHGIENGGSATTFVPYSSTGMLADTGLTCIPTLMAIAGVINWAFGLGKNVDDSPNSYVYILNGGSALPVGIDSSKCIVSSNGVDCFGSYITSTKCFFLLNNLLGYEATLDLSTRTVTYTQLTIPTGESIIQYADGYYITSDLSLYTINDGGTFITSLAVGSSGYVGTNVAKYMGIA